MSLKSPPEQLILTPTNITNFPREIHLNILTFLRATDLSSLQRTSRTFNNRILIGEVVNHYANVVVSFCVLCVMCMFFRYCCGRKYVDITDQLFLT